MLPTALGIRIKPGTQRDRLTLFGRYEVIDAVKTIEPLVPLSIHDWATAVAQW